MTKEFISLLDGCSFETEEEALSYLIKHYLEETTIPTLTPIQHQLERALPGFSFHIVQQKDDEGNEQFIITITSPTINMPYFHFTIQQPLPNSYQHDQNEFPSLQEAIVFYQRFLHGANVFATRVLEQVKPFIPHLVDCTITQIVQTYGTADSFNEYHFSYQYADGSSKPGGYIQLNTHDLESDKRLEVEIDAFTKRLLHSFVSSIEGVVTKNYPKYQNDHRTWYEIDGIPIDSLAKRANILRVEILESKEYLPAIKNVCDNV